MGHRVIEGRLIDRAIGSLLIQVGHQRGLTLAGTGSQRATVDLVGEEVVGCGSEVDLFRRIVHVRQIIRVKGRMQRNYGSTFINRTGLMRHRPLRRLATMLTAGCYLYSSALEAVNRLSDQESQGQALFLSGQSNEGLVTASVGAGNVQVPVAIVPCASCHGRDGRGRPEGGVTPPNITWPVLSAYYAAAVRQRPAYSDTLAIRAITLGLDSGGHQLDPTMPRFHLSQSDAAALVAYLKRLGNLSEPGLRDDALSIGTVLGQRESAVGFALSAYFDKTNHDGGLLGRQLELHIAQLKPGDPPSTGVAQLIGSKTIFALLAPAIDGGEQKVVTEADAEGIPTVGPLTQKPEAASPSRYVFYLNGGIDAGVHALAGFALSLAGVPVVADDDTPPWHAEADAAIAVLSSAGDVPRRMRPGDAAMLTEDGPILWLTESALAGSYHVVLVPSALAAHAFAHYAPAEAWVAFTEGRPDVTAEAAAEYQALAEQYGLPHDDQREQLQALAAAKILIEALRRVGREVTRESLVDALERLQDFHTGLIPPVSYSATRRIGTDGVWIVPLRGGRPVWWNR
jgi:ABC-type branched-subunit amino acid transport system substrate-binding protein